MAFLSVGLWRSLVARNLGVVEVAGSNPVSPTNLVTSLSFIPFHQVMLQAYQGVSPKVIFEPYQSLWGGPKGIKDQIYIMCGSRSVISL